MEELSLSGSPASPLEEIGVFRPPSPTKKGPFASVILKAGVCMYGGGAASEAPGRLEVSQLLGFGVSLPRPPCGVGLSGDWGGQSREESSQG